MHLFGCIHMQAFFLGSAIILQAMGAHPIALEMMDAMRDSRKCALQPSHPLLACTVMCGGQILSAYAPSATCFVLCLAEHMQSVRVTSHRKA